MKRLMCAIALTAISMPVLAIQYKVCTINNNRTHTNIETLVQDQGDYFVLYPFRNGKPSGNGIWSPYIRDNGLGERYGVVRQRRGDLIAEASATSNGYSLVDANAGINATIRGCSPAPAELYTKYESARQASKNAIAKEQAEWEAKRDAAEQERREKSEKERKENERKAAELKAMFDRNKQRLATFNNQVSGVRLKPADLELDWKSVQKAAWVNYTCDLVTFDYIAEKTMQPVRYRRDGAKIEIHRGVITVTFMPGDELKEKTIKFGHSSPGGDAVLRSFQSTDGFSLRGEEKYKTLYGFYNCSRKFWPLSGL